MPVVRVCYKHGVKFDENYYISKHIPLFGSVMGPLGLRRIELARVSSNMDGSAPQYQVMFSAYFDTQAQLQKALQSPRMPEILGDIPNYYPGGMPDVFIGEVVALTQGAHG